MTVPSVKGIQPIVDDLRRLLETGELTREELGARLTPKDLAILESKIGPATWVPIDTYRRALDVLISIEAQGDTEGYLFRRGWRVARSLHKVGLYCQFDAKSEKWGMNVGKLIVTLGPALFNFTEWKFELEPGTPPRAFKIIVSDADQFPDCLRFTAHGFIAYLAQSAASLTLRVTSERLPDGRILFAAKADGED